MGPEMVFATFAIVYEKLISQINLSMSQINSQTCQYVTRFLCVCLLSLTQVSNIQKRIKPGLNEALQNFVFEKARVTGLTETIKSNVLVERGLPYRALNALRMVKKLVGSFLCRTQISES